MQPCLERLEASKKPKHLEKTVNSGEGRAERNSAVLAEIKAQISYDPKSGILTKTDPNAKGIHGRVRQDGYMDTQLKIQGKWKKTLLHRIAWLLTTGEWPDGLMDHRSGCRSDNSWRNLRMATTTQNARNKRTHKNNTSRLKGVSPRKYGCWRARITVDKKRKHLGDFKDKQQAHDAYKQAAAKYFGDYARSA